MNAIHGVIILFTITLSISAAVFVYIETNYTQSPQISPQNAPQEITTISGYLRGSYTLANHSAIVLNTRLINVTSLPSTLSYFIGHNTTLVLKKTASPSLYLYLGAYLS